MMDEWTGYDRWRTAYPPEWDVPSCSELIEHFMTEPCDCGNTHVSEFSIERYECGKESFTLLIQCNRCETIHDLSYEPDYDNDYGNI